MIVAGDQFRDKYRNTEIQKISQEIMIMIVAGDCAKELPGEQRRGGSFAKIFRSRDVKISPVGIPTNNQNIAENIKTNIRRGSFAQIFCSRDVKISLVGMPNE